MWSSGQGHFSVVKNLDPGRSSVYSAYGSDPPLIHLEYSRNKCCNLIGHSEVSISHRDLQVFHRDLQVFHRDLQLSGWGQKSVSLQ